MTVIKANLIFKFCSDQELPQFDFLTLSSHLYHQFSLYILYKFTNFDYFILFKKLSMYPIGSVIDTQCDTFWLFLDWERTLPISWNF